MPLDAVCLSAVVNELNTVLADGKVDKVQQPEKDEIIISFRARQGNCRLLISAGTGDARMHLSTAYFENPQQPPMFCMLLRKHLTGAVLTELRQTPGERAAELVFSVSGAFGETGERRLVAEMMGRYSNIILVDGDGTILDCLRRVDMTMSEKRQVLPGLKYRVPPAQDKIPFFNADTADKALLSESLAEGKKADKWLLDTYSGISPLGCREIAYAAFGDTDTRIDTSNADVLFSALDAAVHAANERSFTPCMLWENGRPRDFYCFNIRQYGDALKTEIKDSFSQLLEDFYSVRAGAERVRQRSAAMTKSIKNARDRLRRKIAVQNEELKKTFDRERLRQFGDIVSANIHLMSRGMTVLRAEDFYDPEGKLCEIPIDPAKSPQQNAAKFYKEYTKAKNAEKILTEQIISGENELDYLNSVLEEIERAAGERDLSEIRQELEQSGYLRAQNKGGKQKPRKSEPMSFVSSTGKQIRIGKNNTQNDQLTLKASSKTDIWLHTQKIHGSHVVISSKDGTTDEATLTEAAMLAALYSRASRGSSVPVDYTMVKFVKKPAGAKPGMVIYTDYKTVYVTPDEKLPEILNEKQKG